MIKITKKKFISYEKVRVSGVTNMWDTALVSDLSGLNREEVLDIISNYGKYKKEFMPNG